MCIVASYITIYTVSGEGSYCGELKSVMQAAKSGQGGFSILYGVP